MSPLILRPTFWAAAFALPVLSGCAGFGGASATGAGATDAAAVPQLRVMNADRLAATRVRVMAGDPALMGSLETLVQLADAAIDEPMRSVADKKDLPPSGDKHDYVSLSPYWWPNPDTPDGLPYIRKDGEFNPERDQYDVSKLGTFGTTVTRLSYAYYYTGDERYAEAAVARLKHFLIDSETVSYTHLTLPTIYSV